MSSPPMRSISVGGHQARVWEAGIGPTLFWLAVPPMPARWGAAQRMISRRARLLLLAPDRTLMHAAHLDRCLVVHDLLRAAGFDSNATLVAASGSGAIAVDLAAIWPEEITSLVLLAPHESAPPPAPTLAADAGTLTGGFAARGGDGVADRLSRVDARTLLLWGDADALTPPFGAMRWAEGIGGNADLVMIPGAGHAADIEAPAAVAGLVLAFAGLAMA